MSTTINQLKKRISQLNKLIAKFLTVRSLVRKWVFELVVLEGRLEAMEMTIEVPFAPLVWCLKASNKREQLRKKWVAQIVGKDPVYNLARKFIDYSRIEWGHYGSTLEEYTINLPGYYQDSDGDYFRVFHQDGRLEGVICSYQEVKENFK